MKSMARKTLFAAMLAVLAITMGACTRIVGTGEILTIPVEVGSFSRLEVSSSFVVNVAIGERPSLTLSIDQAAEDHLRVGVAGDTLRIGVEARTMLSNVTLEADLVVPSLEAIEGSGASEIHVSGLSGPTLEVELSGASVLDGTVDAESLTGDLSGASTLAITGRVRELRANASGASHFSLLELVVADLTVDLSGASEAEVNVTESLTADLSGASSLRYRGTPGVINADTSGASSVEPLSSS
jgi:Putative auto-transporter adhesin, head GIN domain